MTEAQAEADRRRARQAAHIGFIPAPGGHSALAIKDDDDRLVARTFRVLQPDGGIQAYSTADGVVIIDCDGQA